MPVPKSILAVPEADRLALAQNLNLSYIDYPTLGLKPPKMCDMKVTLYVKDADIGVSANAEGFAYTYLEGSNKNRILKQLATALKGTVFSVSIPHESIRLTPSKDRRALNPDAKPKPRAKKAPARKAAKPVKKATKKRSARATGRRGVEY